MSDRDDTPTFKRKARVQSGDARALASAAHRKLAPATGVPIMHPDTDETTDPFDLFDPQRVKRHRRREDSAVELAAQLRHGATDPYDLIAAMAFELTDNKQEARSGSSELDAKLEAFLSVQPGGAKFTELSAAVAELAPVRGGLRWLQASLVIVVLGIGGWLYARGGKETAIDMRIEQLREDVKTMQGKIDRLTRQIP